MGWHPRFVVLLLRIYDSQTHGHDTKQPPRQHQHLARGLQYIEG